MKHLRLPLGGVLAGRQWSLASVAGWVSVPPQPLGGLVQLLPVVADALDHFARLIAGEPMLAGEIAHLVGLPASDPLPVARAAVAFVIGHGSPPELVSIP